MQLTYRDEKRLAGVHPKLVEVIRVSAAKMPLSGGLAFTITEGLRSVERQRQLVASGASRTMASKHLTGHAVDVAATVEGDVRWDWPLYQRLADTVLDTAQIMGVEVMWGGNWATFKDGPHFEIDPKKYPI